MDELSQRGRTACYSAAGLAGAGKALTIAGTLVYAIDGRAGKPAVGQIEFTAAPPQAPGTQCLYLVQVNAEGEGSTVKGNEVKSADLAAGANVLQWPSPSADNCPVGAVRVATGPELIFVPGTTSLPGEGVTYYDFIGSMPSKPLTPTVAEVEASKAATREAAAKETATKK